MCLKLLQEENPEDRLALDVEEADADPEVSDPSDQPEPSEEKPDPEVKEAILPEEDQTVVRGRSAKDVDVSSDSSVPRSANYRLKVWDANGSFDTITYSVNVENHLTAYPEGAEDQDDSYVYKYVRPKERVSLKAIVTADDKQGMQYSWTDDDGSILEGAGNSPEYIIDSAEQTADYHLKIADRYGQEIILHFYVKVENHLNVREDNTEKYVTYGEGLTLSPVVTADDISTLMYEWTIGTRSYDEEENRYYWDYRDIDDADTAEYFVPSVTQIVSYNLKVLDIYGNSKSVTYYVYVQNHLKVTPDGNSEDSDRKEICVRPKAPVTLRAIVSAEDKSALRYVWRDRDGKILKGVQGAEYKIASVKRKGEYSLTVSDQYGNSKTVGFSLIVKNDLTVYPKGSEDGTQCIDIYVPAGSRAALIIEASALDSSHLTYRWYDDYWNAIKGAKGKKHTTPPVNSDQEYSCDVDDGYGNEETVYFYVHVDNNKKDDNSRDATVRIGSGTNVAFGTIAGVFEKGFTGIMRDEPDNKDRDHFHETVVSELTAYPESAEIAADGIRNERIVITCKEGECIKLRAVTEAPENAQLIYAWTEGLLNEDGWRPIEEGQGSATSELEIAPEQSCRYLCVVTDQFGNRAEVYYYVYINGITLSSNQGTPRLIDQDLYQLQISAKPGDKLALKTIPDGIGNAGITYQWYMETHTGDRSLVGANTDSIEVTVGREAKYRCEVTNKFGVRMKLRYIIDAAK